MSPVSVPPRVFRRVLGRLAAGVAVVTTLDDDRPRGMTATAICSVSLSPPLVLACLDRSSNTHRAVAASGLYALNLLAEGEEALARRFARDDPTKFDGLELGSAVTGAPLLPEALAWCDCRVEEAVGAGDHTIFVGRVEAAGLGEAAGRRPLVYYRGRYGGVGSPADPP